LLAVVVVDGITVEAAVLVGTGIHLVVRHLVVVVHPNRT
jgi:hypothetical protein